MGVVRTLFVTLLHGIYLKIDRSINTVVKIGKYLHRDNVTKNINLLLTVNIWYIIV